MPTNTTEKDLETLIMRHMTDVRVVRGCVGDPDLTWEEPKLEEVGA